MLDQQNKRKIDNCRDILVGKVPDPKSQVEQITIALIYKFMDDMDKQSEEWGGKASFFTGEYAKYAWSKIFDPRLGGFDLIALYGDAIVKMNQNPNIPHLFRDIFKNAYLPYRDPETLKSFLKQINEFYYDHSERLGDAYEYLLSVLSSQGEAGQFRTPRHIIDFIVEIVDPKKNEAVLDPACGTAGFLISSYRHILKANTKKQNGDKLTPTEKKRLMNNFAGYDISPDMVRLSLVNMYLHGFSNPKIHEYDTLTSEEKWNETADVILANPPFMTPKGGIRPHKRFSVQAKRSEVLFVDYIAEHLNPHGRAGVIVPEGIIFQSSNAYKKLRKMLVDNFLWCVVSLPAGVFNPYAGVKTSILLMDKQLAKKTDYILFIKIENDGFDLGAQRRPIDKNDLPKALEYIKEYRKELLSGHISEDKDFAHSIEKEKIAETGGYNLSGDRYKVFEHQQSDWPIVELGEVATVGAGNSAPQENEYFANGKFPFFRTSDVGAVHISPDLQISRDYVNKKAVEELSLKLFPKKTILFPKSGASTFLNHRVMLGIDGYVSSHLATIIADHKKILPDFLFHLLCEVNARDLTENQNYPSLRLRDIETIKIPLHPLDVQKKIVVEIDGYQKIIEGARQVVDNYKPTIKIDSDWPMVALGDLATVTSSKRIFQDEYVSSGIPFYRTKEIVELSQDKPISLELYISKERYDSIKEKFDVPKQGDILVSAVGTIGISWVVFDNRKFYFKDGNLLWVKNIKGMLPKFLKFVFDYTFSTRLNEFIFGAAYKALTIVKLKQIKIPLPELETQTLIVGQLESEQEMVNANKKLIEIYERKIKDKIAEVWGFGTSQAAVEKKADEIADSGLLIAEVVERYRTDASVACLVLQHFKERVKPIREFHLQKYVYIAQQYLKLPIVSEFQPMAAGPWSSAFKNYGCAYARQQQWFSLKGRNVEPGKALKAGTAEAEKILGRQRGKVLHLLDDLKRFGDSGLERWATILMVVSQLKAARKAVTRWNIQEAIDKWSGKRNKEWFTKISVSKAIDGMNQKGWIKLIDE